MMMNNPLYTPWKIWNRFGTWLSLPVVRVLFLMNGINWGKGWRFFGVPILQRHRKSEMVFGDYMQLRSTHRSNPLGPNHPVFLTTWRENAELQIGEYFAMTGGTICAAERISIADHVTVGANVTIVDTDFHPIDPDRRLSDPAFGNTAPVVIEQNVFIGMNSLILKGVHIGESSVIGAGSVVTKDIPARTVSAGNPAKIIKEL